MCPMEPTSVLLDVKAESGFEVGGEVIPEKDLRISLTDVATAEKGSIRMSILRSLRTTITGQAARAVQLPDCRELISPI